MKLKKCPFCLGKAYKGTSDHNDDRYIYCGSCGAGTKMFWSKITWKAIAEQWNRRTTQQEK